MKKIIVFITTILAIGLITAVESSARRGMTWKGSGGWGMESPYNRIYDPKTVETLSGEVLSVDKITPIKGMSYGVHLTLKTDKETVSVHLGPGWYIENQDVKIEPKDKVEVTGSRVTFDGKPAVVAAEIKKGDESIKLRDESGYPVWTGWRKR
jgi:hypothetical protein